LTTQDLRLLRSFKKGALVLLLAVGVALLVWLFRAADQRNAVVTIENAGGVVVYSDGNRSKAAGQEPVFRHFVASVTEVHWRRPGEELPQVARLSDLKVLRLRGATVSDDRLACLAGLKLERLDLSRTNITDADLVHVGRLAEMRHLDLSSTTITDAGTAHLAGLANLESLNVVDTRITGFGLAALRRLPSMKVLDSDSSRKRRDSIGQVQLWGGSVVQDKMRGGIVLSVDLSHTDFGDDRISVLSGFPELEYLDLAGTNITDAGLAGLGVCSNLRDLILSATAVSDAGLDSLTELQDLDRLDLYQTDVTSAGTHELQQALPGLKITN
jgi:uncharacterized protein YjbI with pentapeptide repeats